MMDDEQMELDEQNERRTIEQETREALMEDEHEEKRKERKAMRTEKCYCETLDARTMCGVCGDKTKSTCAKLIIDNATLQSTIRAMAVELAAKKSHVKGIEKHHAGVLKAQRMEAEKQRKAEKEKHQIELGESKWERLAKYEKAYGILQQTAATIRNERDQMKMELGKIELCLLDNDNGIGSAATRVENMVEKLKIYESGKGANDDV